LKPSRFEPFSLLVIAICVAWTSQFLFFGRDLEESGAVTRYLLWEGDWWRAGTTILLHAGWVHLIVNCLAIYFVGPVLVQGVGGPVFLGTVFFSGLAGLAASLWTHEPIMVLVGISGGVLGLLGLVVALEWRHARGWMEFFRARNTRVIIFLLVLNAAIAVIFELTVKTAKLDHAAHLGGLVFGLLGGLALFGRQRLRLGRGLLAALLLAVLPLAAAAYPQWSKDHIPHLRGAAERAARAGNTTKQRRVLARIIDLDPQNPIACAQLALLDDDPAPLERAREPAGDHEKHPFVLASLKLGNARLESDPETARRLIARAAEIPMRSLAELWLLYGRDWRQRELTELASIAFDYAAKLLPTNRSWEAAYLAMPLYGKRLTETGLTPEQRGVAALETAKMLLRAAGGLADDRVPDEAERVKYEQWLARFASQLSGIAKTLDDSAPESLPALRLAIYKLWERIAKNTEDSPDEAQYYFLSGVWWWIATDGAEPDAIAARMRAALELATDPVLKARIANWARSKGLNLAPPGDGG
jgi:membrane associated rhomboid family serine protease